jgi:dTDP-4-dehydrorhamnose reductase
MGRKKTTIGVLGGNGLLGSNLCRDFAKTHAVDSITRENYMSKISSSYDVLVNANGNSRRFWANEHPLEDFAASTESVCRSLFDFRFKKYIYISTPDAYSNHARLEVTSEDMAGPPGLSPYGLHKWLSEQLVKNYAASHLILRMASLLGPGLKKGVIYDTLQNKLLFVSQDSHIQFITTNAVADIIETLVDRGVGNEIFNMGGRGAVVIGDLPQFIGRKPQSHPDARHEEYELNVSKLQALFPLKSSQEYLMDFWRKQAGV